MNKNKNLLLLLPVIVVAAIFSCTKREPATIDESHFSVINETDNTKQQVFASRAALYDYHYDKDTLIINGDTIQIIKANHNSNPQWVKAYLDYLYNQYEFELNRVSFFLAHIDKDTIPELIIDPRCIPYGITVLSWHEDSISTMNTWRDAFEYIPYSGMCGYFNGHQGHYYYHYFELTDGGFNKIYDYDEVWINSENHEYENKISFTYRRKRTDPLKADSIRDAIYYSKGTPVSIDSLHHYGMSIELFEILDHPQKIN